MMAKPARQRSRLEKATLNTFVASVVASVLVIIFGLLGGQLRGTGFMILNSTLTVAGTSLCALVGATRTAAGPPTVAALAALALSGQAAMIALVGIWTEADEGNSIWTVALSVSALAVASAGAVILACSHFALGRPWGARAVSGILYALACGLSIALWAADSAELQFRALGILAISAVTLTLTMPLWRSSVRGRLSEAGEEATTSEPRPAAEPAWMSGEQLRQMASDALTIAAFSVVGGMTGWFVGSSRTPVVAGVLPLVFGLVGGLGVGFFEKRQSARKLLESLKALDENERAKLAPAVESQKRLTTAPSAWLLSVIAFCGCCFWGVQRGIAVRVGKYPDLAELTRGLPVSPRTWAQLHHLRWELLASNVPTEDVVGFFDGLRGRSLDEDELRAVIGTLRTGTAPVAPASEPGPPLWYLAVNGAELPPEISLNLLTLGMRMQDHGYPSWAVDNFMQGYLLRILDTEDGKTQSAEIVAAVMSALGSSPRVEPTGVVEASAPTPGSVPILGASIPHMEPPAPTAPPPDRGFQFKREYIEALVLDDELGLGSDELGFSVAEIANELGLPQAVVLAVLRDGNQRVSEHVIGPLERLQERFKARRERFERRRDAESYVGGLRPLSSEELEALGDSRQYVQVVCKREQGSAFAIVLRRNAIVSDVEALAPDDLQRIESVVAALLDAYQDVPEAEASLRVFTSNYDLVLERRVTLGS